MTAVDVFRLTGVSELDERGTGLRNFQSPLFVGELLFVGLGDVTDGGEKDQTEKKENFN